VAAITVNVTSFITAQLPTGLLRLGRTTPVAVTAASGLVHDQTLSVTSAASVVLFDATQDIADFDFLAIVSDQDIYLELTADQNGSFGDELLAFKLKANVPFFLAYDDAYANYTANFGGGTLDVIDRIRAKAVATTASVRVVAIS
jgi:hypothetical protein